jgi:tRNA-specific 2-thiouridylase
VTLQLYDHGAATHRKGACCAGQDIHDARGVAERIGIPHYVLDYESRFKEMVIDRFAESYVAGETPVPCIDCNQSIKFRDLLSTARELGAEVLATGHTSPRAAAGGRARALPGARERARPELFPCFATTRGSSSCCASARRRGRAETRRGPQLPVGRRQARQPGHLLVPSGRYTG